MFEDHFARSPLYSCRVLCLNLEVDAFREEQSISILIPSLRAFASLSGIQEFEIY